MKHNSSTWSKLVTAARSVQDNRPDHAPLGFSTRVVSLARAVPHSLHLSYEIVSFKAMLCACSIAAVVFVANTSNLVRLLSHDDPTTELVDLSLD
jgi:hypothetical protein